MVIFALACIGALCVVCGTLGLFFLLKSWFAQERYARKLKLAEEAQAKVRAPATVQSGGEYQAMQDSLTAYAESLMSEEK